MVVRPQLSDGIIGLGEGATIAGLASGPESPEGMRLTLDTSIAPLLLGADPTCIAPPMAKIGKVAKRDHFTKCASRRRLMTASAGAMACRSRLVRRRGARAPRRRLDPGLRRHRPRRCPRRCPCGRHQACARRSSQRPGRRQHGPGSSLALRISRAAVPAASGPVRGALLGTTMCVGPAGKSAEGALSPASCAPHSPVLRLLEELAEATLGGTGAWFMSASMRSRSLLKSARKRPDSERPRGSLMRIGSTKLPLIFTS